MLSLNFLPNDIPCLLICLFKNGSKFTHNAILLMLSVVCSVGGKSVHAEAVESPAEEAVPDCEGENPFAGGAQQSDLGP